MGGRADHVLNTGDTYDPVTDTWQPIALIDAPDPRKYHSAIWTGKVMIVWGGEDGSDRFQSGGIYDPLRDSWSPTAIDANTPTLRTIAPPSDRPGDDRVGR